MYKHGHNPNRTLVLRRSTSRHTRGTRVSVPSVTGESRPHPDDQKHGSKHGIRHKRIPVPTPDRPRLDRRGTGCCETTVTVTVVSPVTTSLSSPSYMSVVVVTVPSRVRVCIRPPLPFHSRRTCASMTVSLYFPPTPVHTRSFRCSPSDINPLLDPPDHTQVPPMRRRRETVRPYQTVVSTILHPRVLHGPPT